MSDFRRQLAVGRRHFLKGALAGALYLAYPRQPVRAAGYQVGVGKNSDPYAAAVRAIDASGGLSPAAVAGRKVLIKPNLVLEKESSTGVTTDPEVVRAIVDKVLAAGAAEVVIIEGISGGSQFAVCGYDFFNAYDAQGRVSVIDLFGQPDRLVAVPGGLAYSQIYLPELLFEPDTFLISAAKMKTHFHTLVSLATKNAFGLPVEDRYRLPESEMRWRVAMHYRGANQAILDLNVARPSDFAVVDGVWAMEGRGPSDGTPVRMDTVIAGDNAVAVDRVALICMGMRDYWVQHLTYASRRGLGPASRADISIQGDSIVPRSFRLPLIPPVISYPWATYTPPAPGEAQTTTVDYWLNRESLLRGEIVRTSETSTQVERIRLLHEWASRPAGMNGLTWDGRDDQGAVVPPGIYQVKLEAQHHDVLSAHAFATGWVEVADSNRGQVQSQGVHAARYAAHLPPVSVYLPAINP